MKTKSGKPTESWIEYLEDELDPSLREDYAKLLLNSKADEKILEDLKRLRGSIRHADPYKKSEFNQKLFENIMSEIHHTPVQPRWQIIITQPKTWGPIAASVILFLGLSTGLVGGISQKLFSFLNPSSTAPLNMVQTAHDKSDLIVQEAFENPEVLAQTLNLHKTDEDFTLDRLAYHAEDMSDDELAQVMEDILK